MQIFVLGGIERVIAFLLMQLLMFSSKLIALLSIRLRFLGSLVTGVAHEINSPISFLNVSVKNANNDLNDLLHHLSLYQAAYPEP